MSIFPKFFLTLFKSGLVRPIWERVSALYLNFLDDNYIVSGTSSTFDSYVTHSRNGNATMTDGDGLIKWAPHNLIARSEEINSWTAGANTTVTANYAASPDGTLTADRIVMPATSNTIVSISTASIDSGISYTFSVWVKATSGTSQFDLATTIESASGTTLGTQTATSDWQLFEYQLTSGTSGSRLVAINNGGDSYASDILVWGAHLYRSDLGGMVDNPDRGDSYVPTTSSAVYLPRRGHHVYNGSTWVNEGLLVESESRTNLITYSEDFTNAVWNNLNASSSVTANATTAPSGEITADFFRVATTTNIDHLLEYSTLLSATGFITCSIKVKPNGIDQFRLAITGSAGFTDRAWVNTTLSTKAQVTGTDGTGFSVIMSSVSGPDSLGFYTVDLICSTTQTSVRPYIVMMDGSGNFSFAGTIDTGLYIYGAQLEAGSTPSSYIPTAGSAITRAAETLTIPSANLPWPTPNVIGSELVTNGTFDTDSDWTKGGSATIAGGVASFTASADEIYQQPGFDENSVYLLTFTATGSGSLFFRLGSISTNVDSISSSGTYEFYVRPTSSAGYLVFRSFGFVGSIDNVSVKEIDPLSVSIQMDGRMTYADEGDNAEIVYLNWETGNDQISYRLRTDGTRTGAVQILQRASAVLDTVETSSGTVYSPDILVPFNIASRHGSTFVNGAVEGTALTANTTPTALPDLSSTDLQLAYDYMGTIRTFRIWDADLTDEGIAYVSERSEEPTISLSFNSSESSFTVSDWLP